MPRNGTMPRDVVTPQSAATPQQSAPPAQQSAPPAQQSAPPAQQSAPPAQQSAPPAQQSASPAQRSASPAQQSAPPAQQSAPPAQQSAGRSRQRGTIYRTNASIDQRLMDAQVTLDLVLSDAALQSALARCGYDLARILQGRALRDQAQALAQQQRARRGDERSAIDARDAVHAQAHAVYMRHVRLARVALRDDRGAAEALDLAAARKREPAGWLMQAQQFYANALGDAALLPKLAAFGLTREQLTLGQEQMATVATSVVARQQRKGMKEETLRARDAALRALNRWMQDFMVVVHVALAEQPQALDQLAVVTTSPRH